ncbi:DUF3558 domain-containing protein [Tsukamurella pulmonis]|uniref:DUF3558 domain-containing protein n=1 Tax=Tsukamurella pulmonis TaxID=47312 RepID=UPI0020C7D25C|nr:DUF3558 domain-containing protein [Tsukamurella pulmonis]
MASVINGCTTAVPGEPTSALTASAHSMKALPFTPKINGRTNERTDGTSFEPCNAYTDVDLQALDINPASITDAAQVDSANYRGCHWLANDYTAARGGGDYSQIVGREMTLPEYKKYMSSLPWQPDRIVNGRPLAVAIENNYCVANFASEESIVTTIAGSTNPSPGNLTECDRAIAFASLAITKAP